MEPGGKNLIKRNSQIVMWSGWFVVVFILVFQGQLFTQRSGALDKMLYGQEFSNITITSIIQDKKGFIWFGTYYGLCRFDGSKYIVYKNDPQKPDSISGKDINCLYLDSQGTLWIGTYDGLNRFNPAKDTFTRYQYSSEKPQGLSDNVVQAICEDKEGFLWIGTARGGLNRFDKNTNQFKRFQHDDRDPHSLSHNSVTSICLDYRQALWIGTEDGLNRLEKDEAQGTFTHYKQKPGQPGTLSNNYVKVIHEDRDKILWVGTWEGGLNRYLRENDRFDHYLIRTSSSGIRKANANKISALYHDRFGTLWVGTYGSGLYRFLREKKSFEPYPRSADIFSRMDDSMINTLFEDKTGLLWIGTVDTGIYTYNRRKEQFSHFAHHAWDQTGLSSNTVLSFCEDPEQPEAIIWVGTYYGLDRFDRRQLRFTHFKHDPEDPYSISDDAIHNIFADGYGVLWVGTDNGLNQWDSKTHRFTSFRGNPQSPTTISSNIIRPIYEDKRGWLWIGTANGLNRFNRKEKSFTRFRDESAQADSLNENYILCLQEQVVKGEEVLWVGTYNGGINKLIVEKGKLHYYTAVPDMDQGLSNNIIRTLYLDRQGILWVGTDSGLNRMNPETDECMVFTEKEGLADNRVYGIIEDRAGQLWISTYNGLCRFDKKARTFKRFNEGHGVPIRMFNLYAHYKARNGELFFGGLNGFISFFPRQIKSSPYIPDIVITDFKISHQPVVIGDKLPKAISEADEIHLSYDDNMFSFEFVALDYTRPESNRYRYRLEGLDEVWMETDAQNRIASYANLGNGTYTFTVTGANYDGNWNKKGVSIKIIITPPFWKKWWFRGLLGLGMILFLLAFYLLRTRRLRRKLSEQQRIQKILKKSRDEMEQARDQSEFRRAEIEKLIGAISSLLIAVDAEGNIFQWNETAEAFFNIPAPQIQGQQFVEVLKDYIARDLLSQILEKGLGKSTLSGRLEIPVQFRETGLKLLLGIVNPIMGREDNSLGFLFLAEDITHRREEEMRRNLSQKLESLGKMVGNIAHEIKTPLQYIGNNAYFIYDSFENLVTFFDTLNRLNQTEKSDPEALKQAIAKTIEECDITYILEEGPQASDQIVNGVSRVSTIIQSMMDYTHPGRGVLEQANVHQLVETTLVFIRSNNKEMYDIETEFFPELPEILCYPGELIQVFMNLLINAADAIQEKGQPGLIKISTSVKDNDVVVAVTDNGCGIADEIKDYIYNPFFTTKEVGKGTGQGLALVHNIIIERHKGKLYFESKVGKGTTFYIHLPLPPEDSQD
jgi:ligand-binding sensor domain-containing protein/signal transduction histidine kinase